MSGFIGVDLVNKRYVCSEPRGALMVIGPPGSGKTQAIIMQSVCNARWAPVVSTSIKTEVLAATYGYRRHFGTCWWFDPGGAGGAAPEGVEQVRWNPLVDVGSWDDARSVASRLSGPSRGRGTKTIGGGDHWIDRAESWLAVLLYAAHISGASLREFAAWCVAPAEATNAVEEALIAAELADPTAAPIVANQHTSLINTPATERGSIISTLARIMNIYTSPAALTAGENPNFDPDAFVRSSDTLYITAPVDKQKDFAPLIAGLLESIRLAQYRRRQRVDLGSETQNGAVMFVLDEAANTAPIPLPKIASEAGGQGLHLVAAFQDLSQARAQWGDAAEGFLTLFPEKVILSGMNDERTARVLSEMVGEYDRVVETSTTNYTPEHKTTNLNTNRVFNKKTGYTKNPAHYTTSTSTSTRREDILPFSAITSVPRGQGLYFGPGGQWFYIHLAPHWNYHDMWVAPHNSILKPTPKQAETLSAPALDYPEENTIRSPQPAPHYPPVEPSPASYEPGEPREPYATKGEWTTALIVFLILGYAIGSYYGNESHKGHWEQGKEHFSMAGHTIYSHHWIATGHPPPVIFCIAAPIGAAWLVLTALRAIRKN